MLNTFKLESLGSFEIVGLARSKVLGYNYKSTSPHRSMSK